MLSFKGVTSKLGICSREYESFTVFMMIQQHFFILCFVLSLFYCNLYCKKTLVKRLVLHMMMIFNDMHMIEYDKIYYNFHFL